MTAAGIYPPDPLIVGPCVLDLPPRRPSGALRTFSVRFLAFRGLSGEARRLLLRGGESLPAFRRRPDPLPPPELGGQSKLRLTASLYPAGEVRGYPGGDALKLFRLVGYGSGRRNAGFVRGDGHGALAGHCVFVDFVAAYVNALCLRPRKL